MFKHSINNVWQKIKKYEGEIFYTAAKKLPFTYTLVTENIISTNRTKYNISKSNFEKAIYLMPVECVSQLSNNIRGASYVFAILTDERFN
jgi:hypothetical protein